MHYEIEVHANFILLYRPTGRIDKVDGYTFTQWRGFFDELARDGDTLEIVNESYECWRYNMISRLWKAAQANH